MSLPSRSDEHLSRKVFHLASGTVIAFIFVSMASRALAMKLILVGTLAFIAMDLARLLFPTFNGWVLLVYGGLMRESERRGPSAQLYYLLGLAWAVLFLPRPLAVQAILTLAWMDPVAGLFGLRFGRRPWAKVLARFFEDAERGSPLGSLGAKTVEGSLAGFLAAFLAGVIAWTGPWAASPVGDHLWWPSPLMVGLFSSVGGLVAMVAEAWPSQWDDNINVPFWTGLLLWGLATALSVPLRFS